MDVRIGEISATIVDTEGGGVDDAMVERIVRRVLMMLEAQGRRQKNSTLDRRIASPDSDDVEQYG